MKEIKSLVIWVEDLGQYQGSTFGTGLVASRWTMRDPESRK